MTRAMTEEEFNAWRSDPGTKSILELLAAKREELRQQWEGGSFTDYDKGTTALINVGNLGTCKGYAFIMDLTYEEYESEVADGEPKRTGPSGGRGVDQDV